ncbi:MAG: carbamoyl-phosphate synthase large subunit [Oligoflexia bacterium]|nr:carbamoyl-phosphate synthase large subunit [Oligoflexia bacterium]
MPKRTDIHSILVVGSGPIVIGQACEFDYSGNQALHALKQEGYRTILVNSNPATIMTDPETADAVYVEPLTPEFLEKIIAKERPDAILPTMGGQTALNLAVSLAEKGILEKYGIELIGANIDSIKKAEDRELFRQTMIKAGLDIPKSRTVKSIEEGLDTVREIPFPVILRPSFTLGGEGGGTANNREEFLQYLKKGLELSPVNEVLVEESLIGWKEYELEVVRDCKDNVIIVCSIENLDPMGIHTGDSITVAPAQTLTDQEYQVLRDQSIRIIREIGVDTGGSNIQFAIHPETGRVIVIEMNPRVSRSSALASKATGFPIAKVAARLSVGYTLDELKNDITKTTPASFEPTLDYVVVKIPRFDFDKFKNSTPHLNTTMKSIGEVMAIGATFKEALLKALSSMENKYTWLKKTDFDLEPETENTISSLKAKLKTPHYQRLFYIASALRNKISVEEIHKITHVDPWFLRQINEIIHAEKELEALGWKTASETFKKDSSLFSKIKAYGFSDRYLAEIFNTSESEVRELRTKLQIHPRFRAVDTCAAEFFAETPYLYSTYQNSWNRDLYPEVTFPKEKKSVMILGGGPNRIGQGIEFDYCCVHGAMSLRNDGFRVIMINCNPETVSTDFDISDRLYFEPVTAEAVLEISRVETPQGAIVQFGGQTPLKIAHSLEASGLTILGTSVASIDMAEDREKCEALAKKLGLRQPENGVVRTVDEAISMAKTLGYPILVRPSYVLGGQAMKIAYNETSLATFASDAIQITEGRPLFMDRFLKDAIEVDVDVLCDGETTVVGGLMEHIEEAGIHSGDSSCAIPVFSLSPLISDQIRRLASELALSFQVKGLMNAQFAVQNNEIYLIEVNPRASRTVPFVSKAIGKPLAKIAASIMLGKKLSSFGLPKALDENLDQYHVKGAVFPFNRFDNTDTILGPEMRSTGEVMGRAPTFGAAFAKALIGNKMILPRKGNVFISVRNEDKRHILAIAKELQKIGLKIFATDGTSNFLNEHEVETVTVKKYQQGSPNCVDMIRMREFQLVINTTSDEQAVKDSFLIRRSSLETKIPCITTISEAQALIKAYEKTVEELQVQPL